MTLHKRPAGEGHNSNDPVAIPATQEIADALADVAEEIVKPRQAATADEVKQLLSLAGRNNVDEATKAQARADLTAMVDGDLRAYLDGNLDGVVSGTDFGKAVWRREATREIGFVGALLHVRANKQPPDQTLIEYLARRCDCPSGEASESVATLARFFGRSEEGIREALLRIKASGIFDIECPPGRPVVWRLRAFPAAKALGLPNIQRVLGEAEHIAQKSGVVRSAGRFTSASSASEAHPPEKSGTPSWKADFRDPPENSGTPPTGLFRYEEESSSEGSKSDQSYEGREEDARASARATPNHAYG